MKQLKFEFLFNDHFVVLIEAKNLFKSILLLFENYEALHNLILVINHNLIWSMFFKAIQSLLSAILMIFIY